MDQIYADYCQHFTEKHYRTTGPEGTATIADWFYHGDVRAKMWRWLAAGASRDPQERAQYASWLNAAAPKYGIRGIDLDVQRQMVALMEGIVASRPDPDQLGVLYTDDGASLGAILLQVTYDEGITQPKSYTVASLESLADRFVAPGKQICVQREAAAGITCEDYPPCRHDTSVNVGRYFWDGLLKEWDRKLNDKYFREDAAAAAAKIPKTSAIVVDRQIADSIAASVLASQSESALALGGAAHKSHLAAAISTALVLGGGSFWLARHIARRR